MSVLIKGMEMPKSCGDCNFYYVDYEEGTANCLATSCYVQPHHYHKDNRDPDCPLVEVPTPHGRLIDADKLIEAIGTNFFEHGGYYGNDYQDIFELVCACIDDAPTIIEAEVSGG